MKTTINKTTLLSLLISASVLFTACSDSTGPSIKLNAAVKGNTSLQKQKSAADTLTITEAKFRISELEFESALGDDKSDIEVGPVILSLNLDGGLTEVGIADVPSGMYDELEFEIEKRDDDAAILDSDFSSEDGSEYSVVIKGSLNGEGFTFRSGKDFSVELEFDPAVEINDDQRISVTLAFDINQWFADGNGNVLDPTNAANLSQIETNIENSLDVFEDDDEDGNDDSDDGSNDD